MKLVDEFNCEKVAYGELSDKEIQPEQVLICSKSGMGKTSALEFFIYQALRNDFIVIIVGDVKQLRELGYGIFPPDLMGNVQKKRLKYENQKPIQFRV